MSVNNPLSLGAMLDAAAARRADTPAIVFKDIRISYAELAARADAFARGLLALGLGPGDHVVIWMPNSVEWNVANFAIAKIGAVTVTCNSRYKGVELEYVLRQSDAKALVMMDRLETAGIDYREILRSVVPDVLWQQDRRIVSAKFPELRHVIVFGAEHDPGCLGADAVVRRGAKVAPGELAKIRVAPEAPAAMLYTSGTTGAPKGCLLSHGNFWYKAREYLALHEWGPDDRCLVPVPYFHIFGALGCITANALAGSTQVVMEVFDPEEALRLIERERVTIFSGVPTMFITILGHPGFRDYNLRSLRTGTIGAAPVPVEMMRKILDREHGLGMDATVVYGLTEATADKIRDGWLHTGDMGVKDAQGYLRITGRLSDMIIVGGFNTYPAEIENFYLRHPKILDVSIVGVPDPVLGEVVMAFVIPKAGASLTAQEIRDFAKDQIANFKIPKYVEIVSEFPLTGSAKVQKFKQKAWAVETYGLSAPA